MKRASLVTLALLLGCTPALPPQIPEAPPPPAPPAPTVTMFPTVVPAAAPPPDPNAFDPARIALLLDDPRLASVKAEVDREAYAKAAQELSALMQSAQASDKPAWLYQLGRLRALGGDPGGAAKAFVESASSPWPLADYARLQAAQWLVGIGQHDAAIAQAKAIAADLPITGAVDLVMADALLGKKDMSGAAEHFRHYLGRSQHPPQWVQVALRFANALLQHPSEAHAEEVVRLARRVLHEAQGGQGAGQAKELEKKAIESLPNKKRKALSKLSLDDQIARAKGLLSSGQTKEALAAVEKILKHKKIKKPGELACEAWMIRSEAFAKAKKKPEAADSFGEAIGRCDGEARRVDALFLGGKASSQAGRSLEAIQRYALLEKDFPKHRFADDARVKGARAVLDTKDEARFERMLSTIAEDYPQGDVTNDGLFALALHHIGKGNWAAAIPVLEKALARAPKERAYDDAGRLPYYLARAHVATGEVDKGAAELASVIRDYPLSYYMALAYARLAERDRDAASRALAAAMSREADGPFTVTRGPWADDPAFARAVELARQGDGKLARGELDKLGVGARTAPAELLYVSAFLLAKAGSVTMSHNLFRTGTTQNQPKGIELVDWLDHYPVGRWRAPWEIAYPRPFLPIVAAEAKKQNLPQAFAYAIMREESAFEPRVVSHAKAFGLMQLIVPTAKKMSESLNLPWDEESLKKPEVNVPLGCRYLTVLRGQFADNPLLAIPGYNAGGGAPKKWIGERPVDDFDLWVERIPYEETRHYTKRVITSLAAYEFLYTRDQPSEALRMPLPASPSARAAALASVTP